MSPPGAPSAVRFAEVRGAAGSPRVAALTEALRAAGVTIAGADGPPAGSVPTSIWLVDDALPATADLVRPAFGTPPDASAVRWVICPDEDRRSAIDTAYPVWGRRAAVLPDPLDPAAVARLVERTWPSLPVLAERASPLKVVVAGHDFTFITEIVEYLRSAGAQVRTDYVATFAGHDEAASRAHLEWADVAVAEWCSPVAAWYSRNRPDRVRLIVRLHRAELYTDWPAQVDIGRVHQVVCVSPHYARLTRERTGWPADKVVCVPNYVDCDLFDRPKAPGAEHHLGFIGIVPSRKRFDLALDVLERLRANDPRYRLFVKTKMPWEYGWNWNKPQERESTEVLLRRIQTSPLLADAVVFDPHGADVAAWLRKIGWVLSTSDDESFHLAPAEGMASGAVPAIRSWPGSDTIYDARWITGDSANAMAVRIAAIAAAGEWASAGDRAKRQVRASFDIRVACERFARVLVADLPPGTAEGTLAVPV